MSISTENFKEKISEETYFMNTEVYDTEVLDVYIHVIEEGEGE